MTISEQIRRTANRGRCCKRNLSVAGNSDNAATRRVVGGYSDDCSRIYKRVVRRCRTGFPTPCPETCDIVTVKYRRTIQVIRIEAYIGNFSASIVVPTI